MKRIISVFLIMLLLSTIHVSAAGSVSFSSDSIECKSNRLIEVNFNAECGKKLRAATFEFSFDKSILEFRGVGTPSGTIVEYNEKQIDVLPKLTDFSPSAVQIVIFITPLYQSEY